MTSLAKICAALFCMGIWLAGQCDCRYLPTRSHGDELDKLRELMLQILESSNEEHPPNEVNYERMQQQPSMRSSWMNKLSPLDPAVGTAGADSYNDKLLTSSNRSKFGRGGGYEIGRYY